MTERAEYSLPMNHLMYWPDHRLSEECYQKVKSFKMQWWPGRRAFVATWSPSAEDYLSKTLGLTIVENDEPDDLDARIDCYQSHADNASEKAESAEERVTAITDGIPFGQPIRRWYGQPILSMI